MKPLPVINLIGVVLLSALAVLQWRANRATNLELHQALQAQVKLEAQLAEEKQKAAGCAADLEGFRKHVAETNELRAEVSALTVERDRLQDGIAQWKAAVAERDAHLQKMTGERNDIATKFNELVKRFNATAKTLNERTEQFNELAEKYNSLVKPK